MMLLQHQPPALDRAGRSIGPLVWVTVVLGVTLAAGVARGQVPRRAKRAIDARQAVRIAERFVRENGYTDFIPDDPRRLVPESIEFSRNRRDWLKSRHNELKPQAVGYRNGSRNDPKGWTVGFALVKPTDATPPVGRAVTMDARGRRVRVEHMDFYLRRLEPRPD
jgi:hypothetical protein